jgi:hypothetical protein
MPPSARARRSDLAVYKAVLDALDQVLEDGVPRSAVVGAELALLAEWGHTWTRADAALAGLRARWPPVDAADPALVALLVVARAVARLAHDAGLTAAIAAGHHPAIATLAASLDSALSYARAAHHGVLQAALTESPT